MALTAAGVGMRTEKGKSQVREMIMESLVKENALPQILGRSFDFIITDEWSDFQLPKLQANIASFKDPKFPSADVVVEEEILRSTDPRHPNPDAGVIKQYVMIAGGRRSKPERSKPAAVINAEQLHNRLVAALKKDIEDQLSVNPTYGMF